MAPVSAPSTSIIDGRVAWIGTALWHVIDDCRLFCRWLGLEESRSSFLARFCEIGLALTFTNTNKLRLDGKYLYQLKTAQSTLEENNGAFCDSSLVLHCRSCDATMYFYLIGRGGVRGGGAACLGLADHRTTKEVESQLVECKVWIFTGSAIYVKMKKNPLYGQLQRFS